MRLPLRAAVAAGILAMASASTAAAQIVVLEARGPSAAAYPQGSVLAPNRTISLKAGDRLEILNAGGSHVLNGPAMIVAGQVDGGSKAGLQEIFRKANASRPGIAAVRGFSLDEGKTPPPPSDLPPIWRLDVAAWQMTDAGDSHNFCIAKGKRPVFTRPSAKAESTLVIYNAATHESRSLTWAVGARDLSWPSDMAYDGDGAYALNLDSTGSAPVLWRQIDAAAPSLIDLARSLLDNQCYDQLDSLQSQVVAANDAKPG